MISSRRWSGVYRCQCPGQSFLILVRVLLRGSRMSCRLVSRCSQGRLVVLLGVRLGHHHQDFHDVWYQHSLLHDFSNHRLHLNPLDGIGHPFDCSGLFSYEATQMRDRSLLRCNLAVSHRISESSKRGLVYFWRPRVLLQRSLGCCFTLTVEEPACLASFAWLLILLMYVCLLAPGHNCSFA